MPTTMTIVAHRTDPARAATFSMRHGGVVLTRDGRPVAGFSTPMTRLACPLCETHCEPGRCSFDR